MGVEKMQENKWPVIITIVFSAILFFIGISINYVSNPDLYVNLSSFIDILLSNKFMWILTLQLFALPLIVYFYSNQHQNLYNDLLSNFNGKLKKEKIIANYIENLIQEQYDDSISELGENDTLKQSLTNLRDTLQQNKLIVKKQREEDSVRHWHAEGNAKFGEILRNNNDFETLAFRFIKELTNYIDAIQGGFYNLEEKNDNKYLDLIAFYAFGRKKYADQKIPLGRGLISTAITEQKSIHLKKLPQGYIKVTSGLGHSIPKELLITPLISEGVAFGALEIATLGSFTQDHIAFAEKIGEGLASTLFTIRNNIKTSQLLEESKEQAQALSSQEEEMRQNMEELKATQEEAARQAQQFMRLESTVNHTMIRAEYNINGTLIYANTNFLKKLEYSSNSQVEGKHISMFIGKKDIEWFDSLWDKLSKGGRHFEGYMKHITRTGKDLWTMATYTCIRDDEGEAERILFLALDTTEQKKLMLNLEGVMNAVDHSSIKVEFDVNGNIKSYSDSFLQLIEYKNKEADKLNINDVINPMELESFNKKWDAIVNGINFSGQFKMLPQSNKDKWIQGAFSAVFNMYNEVDKVIFIGHDITGQKKMEIEFLNQNDILKKQEILLKESEKDLSKRLQEAKKEMQEQFKEIENIKIRNERTLEGALDSIVQTKDNKIIFYNKAAENLLGYSNKEVIGKGIDMLFSQEIIENDDFVSKYVKEKGKIVGIRTEVKMKSKSGEELPVLILLSEAKVGSEITYTAFIQNIEVELF